MPGRELISRRTRTEFREILSGWGTLRTIDTLFENEGFSPDSTYDPEIGGQRRTLVEQYYRTIDFRDARQVQRLLRVYEDILRDLDKASPDNAAKLRSCLERDGCRFEDGRILLVNAHLRLQGLDAIAEALDAGEILAQIGRIEGAIEPDNAKDNRAGSWRKRAKRASLDFPAPVHPFVRPLLLKSTSS